MDNELFLQILLGLALVVCIFLNSRNETSFRKGLDIGFKMYDSDTVQEMIKQVEKLALKSPTPDDEKALQLARDFVERLRDMLPKPAIPSADAQPVDSTTKPE